MSKKSIQQQGSTTPESGTVDSDKSNLCQPCGDADQLPFPDAASVLAALDIRPVRTRDLDDATRALIRAQRPSAEEIANDRWNDE